MSIFLLLIDWKDYLISLPIWNLVLHEDFKCKWNRRKCGRLSEIDPHQVLSLNLVFSCICESDISALRSTYNMLATPGGFYVHLSTLNTKWLFKFACSDISSNPITLFTIAPGFMSTKMWLHCLNLIKCIFSMNYICG